jgi:hypothetical protein
MIDESQFKKIKVDKKIATTLIFNVYSNIQGYSGETFDDNFVICNPKYKKHLELDILFNSK